jgi:hypothetical protein
VVEIVTTVERAVHSSFLGAIAKTVLEQIDIAVPLHRIARLGKSVGSDLFAQKSDHRDPPSLHSQLSIFTQLLHDLMKRSKTHASVEEMHTSCATKLAALARSAMRSEPARVLTRASTSTQQHHHPISPNIFDSR